MIDQPQSEGAPPGALLVCPLSQVEATFRANNARDRVTLLTRGRFDVPELGAGRHIWLELSDITTAADGYTLAAADHIDALLRFAEGWNRRAPLLIHCYAGVSRSTAAAYIIACALRPDIDERAMARWLRTASATATPNSRMVALADTLLGRSGRMIGAVEAIGRGVDCFEGTPFSLDLGAQIPPYQS